MTSWKVRGAWFVVALVVAGGCEVSTDDGDFDFDQGGRGGTATANGGTGAGRGGTSAGGSGMGGTSSNGGSSMTDAGTFPTPTCDADDEDDECIACLKSQCCNQWRECDDQTCSDEFTGTRECLESIDFPEAADYYDCSMENVSDVEGMVLADNTNALLLCIVESVNDADSGIASARCGEVCFGLPVLQE